MRGAAFEVVEAFEKAVADFSGARYCVATNTGTSAIFLSLKYRRQQQSGPVIVPSKTFISVPMAVLEAGFAIEWDATPWSGVYELDPLAIIDGALRFKRGMYAGGLHCLSFHARKILNIGEGGAVLTDDIGEASWLKAARYSGRTPPNYDVREVSMRGFQAYMTPEKAARGLHLMEYIGDGEEDQVVEYPDLSECPAFNKVAYG